jgi:hypothetical protein
MSSRAKSVGRASLAALLTLGLTAVAVLAETGGGKPDWAGHKPDGKHGGPDRASNGSPARSPDLGPAGGARGVGADSVLAAGATAAMVSALLGAQAQSLAVGARPLPPGIQKNLAREKPLPPGIAKQAIPQPVLDNRLALGSTVSDNVSAERRLSDLLSIRRRGVVTEN